jgi:hypothetical protein
LDLSEYIRPDLTWYNDTFLQHFSYLFGKELYNYETNEVELDRLIRDGEAFGGYDSILLWHQYPRLGVDRRNQWDFFDDFPGGKEGLKEIVRKAHAAGIKVFLPFKPWDVAVTESPAEATEQIARLIEETDIDGIFLDTMDSVPKSFRDAIDRVKPGVVFCSEGHPSRKHNIKMITGSWDQFWNVESIPEVDLMRYVVPEHRSVVISRWNVGERKNSLIKRAIFNGTGIVIWQDIFGSWLPYTEKQKSDIKKWKTVWKSNKSIYLCSKPMPLYPTLVSGLYCNLFLSDDNNSVIYSLYNDTNEMISGSLVNHIQSIDGKTTNCWDEQAVNIVAADGRLIIVGSVNPKDVAVIKVSI